MPTSTKETTITDQTTLDAMIAEADLEAHVAWMLLDAIHPWERGFAAEYASRKARALRADIDLTALRELVAEA